MKKSMMKSFAILVTAVMVSLSLTSAVSAKSMQILLAYFEPEQTPWSQMLMSWGDGLEKATNGEVKVTYNLGGGMVKPGETYDKITSGIIDGGPCVLVFGAPGQFPMVDAISLPFYVPSAVIGGKAMMEYYKKGYLDRELSDVKSLFFMTGQGDTLFTKKRAVTTLKDMKGLKIAALSPIGQAKIKLWGGIPTALPPTDFYMGLQKGIIDGIFLNANMLAMWKLHEHVKYRTLPQEGTVSTVFALNKDTWDRLPPAGKAYVEASAGKYAEMANAGWDNQCAQGMELFKQKGGKEVSWTPEAMKQRQQLEAPLWDNWIKNVEKKGLPGKDAVKDLYYTLENLGVKPTAVGYRP